MTLTRAQILAAAARQGTGGRLSRLNPNLAEPAKAPAPARGMNRWEREYADLLERRRASGLIRWWKYESVKLRLADRTWYTPDFFVAHIDGPAEFVEVKGFLRDDAAVKWKVATETFPDFIHTMVKKVAGAWEVMRQSRPKR